MHRTPVSGGSPVIKPQFDGSPSETVELAPVFVYAFSPSSGEAESRYRNLPLESLVHPYQLGCLEFGDVARQVALGETGEPLQIEEVGGATGIQSSQDGQAGGFMDEPVELGQLLEGSAHGPVLPAGSGDTGGSRCRSSR